MLTDGLYWAAADSLALAARLGTARDLPSADILQRRIMTLLEQMEQRAGEAGVSREDILEVKYALAAFIDEQISRSPWPAKQQWLSEPLQLVLFNENTAGEGFFHHMAGVENDPSRAHVLQIYYLCLQLGFQGMYAVRGGQGLSAVIESAGAKVARAVQVGDAISPHGVPTDVGKSASGRQAPIIAAAVAFFVLSLLGFGLMKGLLALDAGDAKRTIHTATSRVAGSGG